MNLKSKRNTIRNMIKKGFVKNSQIIPILNRKEMQNIDPDEIAGSSFVYNRHTMLKSKTASLFFSLINKIFELTFGVFGSVIIAAYIATKEFSDSLLRNKLNGFWDSLLYWLGLKKIEVSGPDMFAAMGQVFASTPKILSGFFIGAIIGIFSWIVLSFLMRLLFKKITLNIIVNNIIRKYKV